MKKEHGNKGKPKSEEHKRKLSLVKQGHSVSDEQRKKQSERMKGIPKSEEHKQKLSDSLKGRSWIDLYGIEKAEEKRGKLSKTTKGRKHHTSETRKKISEARKGKHHRDETKRKMSIAQRKRFSKNSLRLPWKNTKPEQEAESILQKYNLNYKNQKALKYNDTVRYYDFYLPDYNILLEIDGCYWHSKGIKDEDIKSERLKDMRINDHIKDKLAQDNGYTLIRIWEDELFKLEDYCSEELNILNKVI